MQQKTLILGATSAIAAEVAKICAERGDELYLGGRNPDKLRAVVAAVGDGVVGFESCDFHEVALADERVARWIEQLGGLDRALIAHGYLGDQERSEREVSYAQQVIDTNFVSVVSLLMPLANFFASQGRGHLAAITSVAGERGRPRNYTYGAAKSGLTCYLEGLRSRLYKRGVCVHNLKLGPVATPMSEGHPQNMLWGEKRQVAGAIVRALGRRRHVVYAPRSWRLVMAIVRCLPERVFQRFGFLAGR